MLVIEEDNVPLNKKLINDIELTKLLVAFDCAVLLHAIPVQGALPGPQGGAAPLLSEPEDEQSQPEQVAFKPMRHPASKLEIPCLN